MVKRGFVVAVGGAAIVIAGLSGCSSGKKTESTDKNEIEGLGPHFVNIAYGL